MSDYTYFITANDDRASIVVLQDGVAHQADERSHSNINQIIRAAIDDDPDILDLFNQDKAQVAAVKRSFTRLSDRVTVSNDDQILLDGDPAPPAIAEAIARHLEDGTEQFLVNFLEKLANNPSKQSVEQLYPWLDATGGFTITEDGDLIAYKGVASSGSGGYQSVNHGRAIVDGVEHSGAIPNHVGAVVEMPRSEVVDNSGVGCATGLHAGTYEYAKGWAQGALLEVLIDPRDVVSVPTDCGSQKLRTCRYTVLDVIDQPLPAGVKDYEGNGGDWRSGLGWGDNEDVLDDDFDDEDTLYDDLDDDYEERPSIWSRLRF